MVTKKTLIEMLKDYPDDIEICVQSSTGDTSFTTLPIGEIDKTFYVVLVPNSVSNFAEGTRIKKIL